MGSIEHIARRADARPQGEPSARPRILLGQDAHFHRLRLSEILACAGCEVQEIGDLPLVEVVRRADPPPDLLVLPVQPDLPSTLERIRALRRDPSLPVVPVLGIAPLERAGLDLDHLRSLGVVGLVDRRALPEHVVFRVNQIVRPFQHSRRWQRAPAFFAVDVETPDGVATEYAVSLSVGGMGIRATRAVEPNTDVVLRPSRDETGGERLELSGRVVRCIELEDQFPPFLLGVVFYEPRRSERETLEGLVGRMMRAASEEAA